jgi:hypothetical protein
MSIEAMKDALEALEWLTASNDLAQPEDIPKIVINLRTAIEAAENVQPYGWANLDEVTEQFNSVNCGTVYRLPGEDRSPLYTTPPAQEFVCSTGLCHYKKQPALKPLTNEQVGKASRDAHIAFCLNKHQTYEHALTRAVEAAHGITGETK